MTCYLQAWQCPQERCRRGFHLREFDIVRFFGLLRQGEAWCSGGRRKPDRLRLRDLHLGRHQANVCQGSGTGN